MKLSTSSLLICFHLVILNSLASKASKILGISWYPAISHQAFYKPIWKELSLKGHQVTIITASPMKDNTLKNLTEIDLSFLFEVRDTYNSKKMFSKDKYMWQTTIMILDYLLDMFELMLINNEVQSLLHSEEKFDVILVEPLLEIVFAFGERFKTPVICLSSLTLTQQMYDLFGNPTHPVISPEQTMAMETSPNDHPFSLRLESFLENFWGRMYYYWYFLPKSDRLARKYFGAGIPYLRDISRKYSSIALSNVNILTTPVRANVPSVIEINQIHIRENRSLPVDLQTYLNDSSNGAVYFSFGTHVQVADLKVETYNDIMQALSELPYNVLLKWNGKNLPGIPSNVLLREWFPQQDLLAHPNIKVFVTQGGMQSIEEAISKEVPMVGIPFLGDQPRNVEQLVNRGLALRLDCTNIKKEALKKAIMEVAENKRFKETVKKYKSILQDQPLKGLDKVVWWTEYVIRHKGAEHLRSPAVDMPYYKYFMLDVISFLTAIILCIYFSILKLFRALKSITRLKSKSE